MSTKAMNSFICINCGTNVKALSKKYNESVLKLIPCVSSYSICNLMFNNHVLGEL